MMQSINFCQLSDWGVDSTMSSGGVKAILASLLLLEGEHGLRDQVYRLDRASDG